MDSVRHLIIGAGISGLSTAAFLTDHDYLVIDADSAIGGYCKTVKKEGFVWDYSGHFFHFKRPEIEAWLRERMVGQDIRSVERKTFIAYKGGSVDFPFQKNIHQLPQAEFVECLVDLYFARSSDVPKQAVRESNFKEMLYARFGRGIAEKFLIPYNEKLYACDLSLLDKDAMGRFFPHADLTDIIRNMRVADNANYNATFTYPAGGAIEYVNAIASRVAPEKIALGEALVSIDVRRRIARTTKREIKFENLISSAPFHKLAAMTGLPYDPAPFTWNKVLVFNLGFDGKGHTGRHWVYFPDKAVSFYRIGYYDNIIEGPRMSLYVELGFPRDAEITPSRIDELKLRVVEDLRREGVVTNQKLVADHSVVMDPAYVHITEGSQREFTRLSRKLHANGIYSIGRYGGWTYCSIEDNIVEARELARDLA